MQSRSVRTRQIGSMPPKRSPCSSMNERVWPVELGGEERSRSFENVDGPLQLGRLLSRRDRTGPAAIWSCHTHLRSVSVVPTPSFGRPFPSRPTRSRTLAAPLRPCAPHYGAVQAGTEKDVPQLDPLKRSSLWLSAPDAITRLTQESQIAATRKIAKINRL